MTWRFGTHASLIQLIALLMAQPWTPDHARSVYPRVPPLLDLLRIAVVWQEGRASRTDLFFLRWGLLAFVLVGTPLVRPVVEQRWMWLLALSDLGFARC
jgi:hypothetical protein